MRNFLAILDIGGSGIKLSCRSQDGKVSFTERENLLPIYVNRSATQCPDKVFKLILQVLRKGGEKLASNDQIEKIFISTLRQGFTLIRDKKELTPLIYNSDSTGSSAREEISAYGMDKIYKETGHWYAPQLTLPKLLHLKREDSRLFEGDVSLAFFHDWVIWKLTGHKTSEASLLASGQLWSLKNADIHYELIDYFGFSRSLVGPLKFFGINVDCINSKIVKDIGIPWRNCQVMVGGGDSHFLHYGASAQKSEAFVVSAGSSTPISVLKEDTGGLLDAQPWISPTFQRKHYFVEGNLGYPGFYFNWLTEIYGGKEIKASTFNSSLVNRIPVVLASCQAWSQESWERRPPFAIVDLLSTHSSSDIALGLIIDCAIGIKNQVNALDHLKQREVIITGGGANATLARLLATLANRQVSINYSREVALDAVVILEGHHLPREFETFEPEDDQILTNLLEFEALHEESYSSALDLKELIESVR